MKTNGYYLEIFYAPLASIISSILNVNFPYVFLCKDPTIFISKTVDISFISFGFLLTILALIIQCNPELKSRKIYPRLILYNKRIVFISLILGLVSLIFYSVYNNVCDNWNLTFESFYVFFLIWLILDLIHFINIFYSLAINRDI